MRLEVALDRQVGRGFRLELAFDVQAGVLAVVGESGAGKSCLLESLAGVVPGGRVVLDGVDLARLSIARRGVGWVTQDPLLFPHLDVAANLAFARRAGDPQEVAAALDIGHLLDRRPAHLSGGERRRVSLARALLARPRLLLLDEPFAGLDERRRRQALSLLHRVHARFDVPMVLVSHVPEEVIGLADHALRLHAGRLVAEGRPTAVLRVGETDVDNHLLAEVCGRDRVRTGGVEWQVPLPEGARGAQALAVFAHDVLLARGRPDAISARNVWRTRVLGIEPAGGALLVRLAEPGITATLTRDAVQELGLVPGSEVHALLKATSIAVLGPA